ncbi:hypothetical protein HK100_006543 [Physocladia obscura]|uniref:NACHT domain-containing protein n=1 Tax=Physocladia obscura TaxID=109957 RepID=A0AAD5SRP8_9FUNG|nr:hypothetical protein HK100_006543 [Physocladia obscura]
MVMNVPKFVVSDGDTSFSMILDQDISSREDLKRTIANQSDLYLEESAILVHDTNVLDSNEAILQALQSHQGVPIRTTLQKDDYTEQITQAPETTLITRKTHFSEDTFDVMVWSTSKDLVKHIVNILRKYGLSVWFDEDQMHDNLYDRMAEAIYKSKVICIILNNAYQDSSNCIRECSYAADKNKPFVVVRDTNEVLTAKAPSLLAAGKLYSNFANVTIRDEKFGTEVDTLINNIKKNLASTSNLAISLNRISTEKNLFFAVDFSDDFKKFRDAYVFPTRRWLLNNINHWINNGSCSVLCMLGGAGVGKSMFAWLVHENPIDYVAPAIFFCRHNNDEKNNAKNVITTLAMQLAKYSPEFETHLSAVKALSDQEAKNDADQIPLIQRAEAFKTLILDGLPLIRVPENKKILLIIDALDECGRPGDIGRANLLRTIKDDCLSLPKGIKLFVTSRPELDIVEALECIGPDQMSVREQLAIEDICTYLSVKLTKICADVGIEYDDDIKQMTASLADASQGVFVFAAFACKQLSEFQTLSETFKLEMAQFVEDWCSRGGLDNLYTPFLSSHYLEADESDILMFRSVMGIVVTTTIGLNSEMIAKFLKIDVFAVDAVVMRVGEIEFTIFP